jgi:site-specific DNA recombinase
VRVALYARVSTDVQEARGSIGSQLQTLREWAAREAHDLVAEYIDDGYSGARLDRPGLDALRDSAERGQFETVLCLTPDRLARSYPYQFLVLEELARHSVRVVFFDAPAPDNHPHVRLALVDLVLERAPLLEVKP